MYRICIFRTLFFSKYLNVFSKSSTFSDEAPCDLLPSPASRPGRRSVSEQLQCVSFFFKPEIKYVFKPTGKLQLTYLLLFFHYTLPPAYLQSSFLQNAVYYRWPSYIPCYHSLQRNDSFLLWKQPNPLFSNKFAFYKLLGQLLGQ